MGLAFSQIDDAVLLTQETLIKRGAFIDMQTNLQDFVAVREMWKGRQKKFAGGEDWQFAVQMDHNHSAKSVALFETDGSAVTDTMVMGKVSPRHVNAHYIYDLREPDFQRGGTSIVDLVQTRYSGMIVSLYTLLEQLLWSKPTDSTNIKDPAGIPFWIIKNSSLGFNAENPSGFAAGRANIDSGTYGRWANYSGSYAAVAKEDLIRKMRKASRMTNFRSPLTHAVPDLSAIGNGIYTNDAVLGLLEEELEKQNMNLGNDIASKDGATVFKGTPVVYVPYLDADTQNPVYMIDWRYMAIGVMEGWENNTTAPYMVPDKHNVRRVDVDCTLNMVCTDLRRQAVFYKP